MNVIKEFLINEYLKLKFKKNQEKNETLICVDEKELMVCRFMLLQVSRNNEILLEAFNSIDEVEKFLNNFQEHNTSIITDEEEFFGHCSNLQAWYEHGYDTNLLHRNIAFPLLKKLTEGGIHQQKKFLRRRFMTEIYYKIQHIKKRKLELEV